MSRLVLVGAHRGNHRKILLTFEGETAYRDRQVELINVAHPLVRLAVPAVSKQLENPSARVGQAVLQLLGEGDPEIPNGLIFVTVFTHHIEGIRSRQALETVAWSVEESTILDSEAGERILHLVLESGEEWSPLEPAPAMEEQTWKRIQSEARRRNRQLLQREERENAALYLRRRNVLQAEHDFDLIVKEARLRTAEERNRTRILPALRGQIEKARAAHENRLQELERLREVRARLSDPVAAYAVRVIRTVG